MQHCAVCAYLVLLGSQLQTNVHAGAVLEAGFSCLKLHCDEYINHVRVSELVNAKRQGSLSLYLCAKCQSPQVTCVYYVGQRRSQIQRAFPSSISQPRKFS